MSKIWKIKADVFDILKLQQQLQLEIQQLDTKKVEHLKELEALEVAEQNTKNVAELPQSVKNPR